MARDLRISFEGAWYHAMNRGINHKRIFYNNKHKEHFLKLLNEITKIYGVEIHAYCLMDNHYHLIIHSPRGNISNAMRHLNSSHAIRTNISMKRDGPLFKGRFKAILIGADEYLLQLSRYIHRNPLEANITHNLSAYQWSSYQAYLGIAKPLECLVTREVINRFGNSEFKINYKKYVEEGVNDELNDFYGVPKPQPVLGDMNFREEVFNYVKQHSLSSEIIGADHILVPPSISTIIDVVSNHFNVPTSEIYRSISRIKNIPRRIAIYLSREIGGCKLNDIAKVMGNVSIKTISSTLYRVRADKYDMKEARKIMCMLKKMSKTIGAKAS